MNNHIIKNISFEYPESFKKLIELNLVNFDTWALFETEAATVRYHGLQNRYPKRNLIPFARRWDNDDIACFEIMEDNSIKIQLIHDFASDGWEQRKEFKDFWEWLETAIKDMIEYNRLEGIE